MTSSSERPEEPVVITDKRKVDRGDGESAAPAGPAASSVPHSTEPAVEPGQVPMVEAALLAERTADLQRLQAEYANYRKRSERERLASGDVAVSRVLVDFLPVLDNLDRAEEHGDLTGGLKAVAEQLIGIFAKLGLESFGHVGDPFDPAIHEAVLHDESDDVEVPTCTTVMRPGYKHNDRLLRPAMVGVSDPSSDTVIDVEAVDEPAPEVPADSNE